MKKEICLLNDSFPPLIDGVANTVVNYAQNLKNSNYSPLVVVPSYPGADDSSFDFPVERYPSLDLRKQLGYTAGNPFLPETTEKLKKRNIALLHSHCPISSNFLARGLRESLDVPLVMTYHTKFDTEIYRAIKGKILQFGALKALVESVSSVDELWVVSKGAGENIKKLGYPGDYIVMPNGVDMKRQPSSDLEIFNATKDYDLPKDVPLYLFVGRLMWYKGIRTILDALKALSSQNIDYRMVLIGGGGDEAEIKNCVKELKLENKIIFVGPVHDRNTLAAWYSRADLFLFPSNFDTYGLVVREAAACSTASVVIGGSCASDGMTNGVNGLYIEDNPASLAACLANMVHQKDYVKRLGENASRDLYVSWEDSVKNALARYDVVIDNYKSGKYNRSKDLADEMFAFRNELLNAVDEFNERKKSFETIFEDRIGRYL